MVKKREQESWEERKRIGMVRKRKGAGKLRERRSNGMERKRKGAEEGGENVEVSEW
jgi:hypothetical protein